MKKKKVWLSLKQKVKENAFFNVSVSQKVFKIGDKNRNGFQRKESLIRGKII